MRTGLNHIRVRLLTGLTVAAVALFSLDVAAQSARTAVAAPRPVKFDAATISGLQARNIGSATMSGRIAAVDALNDKGGRLIVFVGAASGGVWKSVNGGLTYKPVFDAQAVQSIGAVKIDPSNPQIVWVGTGESWMRNSVSVGDGIYKSTDGGENWANVGLKESEHISKILVDPANGNNVLACAAGHAWNDNPERGVFRTTDGGKTWRKVLAGTNESTGCGMLAMSPDAKTVFASLWDYRRQGWTFRSGGPGSGLWKSTDGGEHWTELTSANATGLPAKPYGRIALAVAPSKPNVVYAMIESKQSALFRSDDGGNKWTRLDASNLMIWRPFYFANLIVDPKNENKIFKPDLNLALSVNGGRSFANVSNAAHGDFHDVWINPANPNQVFAGDDGGLWVSSDGGTRWRHEMNLPVSQFYHVSVDNDDPYHVYGGLQDNSSWVGDSSYPNGVTNQRWENMYNGDGFWVFEDPGDPNFVYAEAQGGYIGRINRHSLENRAITPYARYGETKLRFNWNTPIHMSPNEKGTIYMGAQYLYRSRDHGQSWDRISPDLTTNDPEKQKQEESGGVTIDNSSAEMHTTIYSISESPKNAHVIWAGTDDGNLQLTRDDGKTWTNVVGNVPSLPKFSWVSWVEASRYNEGTAYASFDRHTFGDMRPYLFKTADFGKTWTALPVAESGVRGYAHVIKEDTVSPNLLFLGTEWGLWVSNDGGQRWAQYKGSNFPAVAVRDIAIQARESDLVLATHGRGIWIIDKIDALRALTPELMAQDAAIINTRPAVEYVNANGGWAEGDATYKGASRPDEALITYYQRSRHIFGDFRIDILDQNGKVLDSISGSKHRGLNRAMWPMRLRPPAVPPAASALFGAAFGPRVLPGTYKVRMLKGDKTYESELKVEQDPRTKYTPEERKAQFDLAMRVYNLLEHMSLTVDQIIGVRDGAQQRAAALPQSDALRTQLTDLAQAADKLRGRIVATKEGGAITGEERLREFIGRLYGDINNYDGPPTASQVDRTEALTHELSDVVNEFNAFTSKDVAAANSALTAKKLEPIHILTEQEWETRRAGQGGGPGQTLRPHEVD